MMHFLSNQHGYAKEKTVTSSVNSSSKAHQLFLIVFKMVKLFELSWISGYYQSNA